MAYTSENADALADVRDAGAAVTFTLGSPGTYDAAADQWTSPSTTTVAGHAIHTRGNPETYRDLGLVEAEAPTLLFVPTTFGEVPDLGYRVTWASVVYTVKQVQPLMPDGTVIMARVVVGK